MININDTKLLMGRSGSTLEEAQILLEKKKAEGAISRCYYAMLYSAQAALMLKGIKINT